MTLLVFILFLFLVLFLVGGFLVSPLVWLLVLFVVVVAYCCRGSLR